MSSLKLKGYQIFWSISNEAACKESDLADLDYQPRNNPATALTAACRVVTGRMVDGISDTDLRGIGETRKSLRMKHYTFADTGVKKIALVKPEARESGIDFNHVFKVSINKTGTANLVYDFSESDYTQAESERIATALTVEWNRQKTIFNRDQISKAITGHVMAKGAGKCNGLNLRSRSGGVYFVANENAESLQKLKHFFDNTPNADLHMNEVFRTDSWDETILGVAQDRVMDDVNAFIENFDSIASSGINRDQLGKKIERAKLLKEAVMLQASSLLDKAAEFKSQADSVISILDSQYKEMRDEYSFNLADFLGGPKEEESESPEEEARISEEEAQDIADLLFE